MSLAVAYGMKKRADKMSRDDSVQNKADELCEHGSDACEMCHGGEKMAEGGDIVDRIMKQRKKYSEGGQIANETPLVADFEDNQFDDLVKRDDIESSYTAKNSGDELGNRQKEEDERDIVARIMKSRRLKDRMPHPA